ncbi:T-cell surface antigen CD2 isoform X2 [Anoplopoma fimbria]|nr:T-cell surface antigen CD2 isoform X2 [Anoplopoma fimbria]XP_054479837.1 T-cell surface antigen CD2 isoform X2 [Anoplopoma fimbria]
MVMKMAAVSTISLLLLCCFAISSTDSEEVCNLYTAKGRTVTMPMLSAVDQQGSLRWIHNDKIILHRRKTSFITGNQESLTKNGSLILTNISESQAGKYTPQAFDVNGLTKGVFKTTNLCVVDPVPKPSVKISCTKSDVTFTCEVQAKLVKDLTFAWFRNKKKLEKEKGPTVKQKVDQVMTDSFSCQVSNKVSDASSEPVTQHCMGKTPIFPEYVWGINTWYIVGAGGGLVLLLMIIVIVCCIRTKRRKRLQLKDEGELRLAWTNEQHQHQNQHNHPPDQHPHHHHPHQQPAGHTGPRQHRPRQHRNHQLPKTPDHPNAQPQPSPRKPAQAPRPAAKIDEEQPPPLPQPRKKATKTAKL